MCCYQLNCCCLLNLVLSHANALYPLQHSHFSLLHQHLFHCQHSAPLYHCRLLYNSLIDFMLELDGCFVSQMSEMTHVASLHLFQASRYLFLQSGSNIKCDPSGRNQSHVGRVRFPLWAEMHGRDHITDSCFIAFITSKLC